MDGWRRYREEEIMLGRSWGGKHVELREMERDILWQQALRYYANTDKMYVCWDVYVYRRHVVHIINALNHHVIANLLIPRP